MTFAAARSCVAGTTTHEVALFGQRVFVSYAVVDDERGRRDIAGLGAVVDRELLGALFELPVDEKVPRKVVSARHQRLFRRAPHGAVTRERRHVERHLVPVVRVAGVAAVGTPTLSRLRRLSEFAPFAPRSLAAVRPAGETEMAEARRLGIELTYEGQVLSPGTPFVVRRHTAASWLFAEMVAAELQRAGVLLAT